MTKMNTMSFILDQRSIEIKRYVIEFAIFDELTFRRVKLNITLMSKFVHISHMAFSACVVGATSAIGPFHGIRFVSDRTFAGFFPS